MVVKVGNPDGRRVCAIGLGLVALQIPFILTRHIQEDAYITFRCAENLADWHVYGFNASERVSASSSHLSVFVGALVRLLTGNAFIPATQVLYGAATITGLYFLATAIVRDPRHQLSLWVIVSLMPVALMISYGGMETGLLVLATGLIVRNLTLDVHARWLGAALFLLPWIRPDAIAPGLLILAAAALTRTTSISRVVVYAALMLASLASWAMFNRLYFGMYLPQTIIAKAIVWLPMSVAESFSTGFDRLKASLSGSLLEPALFLPIQSKYLTPIALPAMVLSAAGMCLVALAPSRYGCRQMPVAALILIACIPPIAYAMGGLIYPWYLWPSQLAISVLLISLGISWIARQRPPVRTIAQSVGIAMVMTLAAGQLVFAVSWGTQERLYRGRIGERIQAISEASDTLLLEPAGYVPFYANLFTWDEIGLTSSKVTDYRTSYRERWWPRFVEDVQPTYLLERHEMPNGPTLDRYFLSADEKHWFDQHYRRVEVFRYQPGALRSTAILGKIAALGSASDYFLYKRIQ
jgi:hypothetical protein